LAEGGGSGQKDNEYQAQSAGEFWCMHVWVPILYSDLKGFVSPPSGNGNKKNFGYIRWPLRLIPVSVIDVRSFRKHRRILGENIRACRKQARMSQEKLAEKADLNTTYVSDVERGEENISVDALVRIATALKTSLAELIRGI
jgi:DNA-binding XRE family transcriptional regulator